MGDLRLRLCELLGDGLISPLLFIVLVKIPLRVLLSRHRRIQRDRDLCIVVIIQTLKTFFSAGETVPVGI